MDSQDEKKHDAGAGKKGGKTKVVIAVGAVVIVALVAVIIFLLLPKDDKEKRNIVVTPDNVEDVIREMQESKPVQAGYYTVKQNSTWTFVDGSSPSENAYVENVANNERDVYFDVFIKGDEEIEENAIYKSPIIPVGSSLNSVALDKDLDAGEYECVMIYHMVDEDQNTLDTLRVSVTIVVLS